MFDTLIISVNGETTVHHVDECTRESTFYLLSGNSEHTFV